MRAGLWPRGGAEGRARPQNPARIWDGGWAGWGRCWLRTGSSPGDPDVTGTAEWGQGCAWFWGGSGSLEQDLRVHLGTVVEGPDCPAGLSSLWAGSGLAGGSLTAV